MPISLLKELQIPVLISNQSLFISGQAVCRPAGRREPFAAELPPRAHSLRKELWNIPSPASSPGCALKVQKQQILRNEKSFLGFWRQFSNASSRVKLILTSLLPFRLAQSPALKTAKLFLLAPSKISVFASISVCLLEFLPL